MDENSLKVLLARGLTISEIAERFGKAPSTIACWMEKYGLKAVNHESHGRPSDVDVERLADLVAAGMTIRQMAEELAVSAVTVRRRLARLGLKTAGTRDVELQRAAKAAGLLAVQLSCVHHGETDFILEGRGYYRCKRCRAERVARRRRRVKSILVAEAGGRCCVCGYDRYVGALEFHHLDPSQKRMEVSRDGVTLSLQACRAEVRKCVLVCSNCHAEVEAGVTMLPDKVSSTVPRRADAP